MDSTWRVGATFYRDCTPESAARQFAQATYGPKWRAIRMGQPYRDLGRPGAFFPALYEDGRMVATLPAFKVEGTYRRRMEKIALPMRAPL